MNHKLNSDGTAAVSLTAEWMPIDSDTPRGGSLWLINKASGVSTKGQYTPDEKFFDYWFPNPTFKKAQK